MMRAPSNCYRPRGPCYFCIKITPAEPLVPSFFHARASETYNHVNCPGKAGQVRSRDCVYIIR